MKGKAKKNTKKGTKNLFADDAILANLRDQIRRSEALEIDKPDRAYSWNKKFTYAIMILASTALEHLSQKERVRVIDEANEIHNRIGVAMLEKRESVDSCLCEKHEECMGRYASIYVNGDVICRCNCHRL